jgi:glycosyltransferase involved in cell wall biosynthesis
LSVVVPVFRVADFVVQCLDSIVGDGQHAADVQVIAVDDRSPDQCGALLDAYARQHGRPEVLHLPYNVGLGRARNAGLDRATGRYVWFVDGDDWLPPGAVSAVLARLRELRPDVLLVDHQVVGPDGTASPPANRAWLHGVAGVARLADRPGLLQAQHAAWNKVVGRELLDRVGLRFQPGWYEDVPFSHPVMLAARRIGVLERVCYCYRHGRPGAITSSPSARHFEVFTQYERMFAVIATLPDAAPFRPELFRLMVDHHLVIAGNDARLPAASRREFFRRAAEHFARYLPTEGYAEPAGVAGVKHRLLRRDRYLAYAALREAYRMAGLLRGERGASPPLPPTAPASPDVQTPTEDETPARRS